MSGLSARVRRLESEGRERARAAFWRLLEGFTDAEAAAFLDGVDLEPERLPPGERAALDKFEAGRGPELAATALPDTAGMADHLLGREAQVLWRPWLERGTRIRLARGLRRRDGSGGAGQPDNGREQGGGRR